MFASLASPALWAFRARVSVLLRSPALWPWFLLPFGIVLGTGLSVTLAWAHSYEIQRRVVLNDIGNWFSSEPDKALLPPFTLSQFVQQIPNL